MAYKKKNTRGPIVDPPFEHHTQPEQISPTTAQESIAKYLTKSESQPYMHPDSFLASTGIRFAIGTGPKGGVALHHLRRIEAGLRGEFLEKETPEQLEALFGDQWRATGDDYMLDSHIADSESRIRKEKKRRKRKREEIEDWVSTSSSQAIADEIIEEMNNQSLGYSKYHHEIESFANTPLHRPAYDELEESQWQDPYYYELNQRVWTKDPQGDEGGAVGTMVQQGGELPEVVEHDREGNVVKETKQLKRSKEEKRAAKKAKREAYKQEKIRRVSESKLTDPSAVREMLANDRRDEEEERRARKEERRKKKAEEESRKGAENGVEDGEEDEGEQKKHKKKKKRKQNDDEVGAEAEKKKPEKREKKQKKDKKEKQAKKESG